MKKLITAILVLCSIATFAQNYNCLQFGPKNYFINGNNYVRGIRIDSTRTSGSDLIYYPYHTLRISNYLGYTLPLFPPPVVDSDGASWLGKKVIQQADGTFLFDNLWDTVIIKTQAHTGDSWIFFNDTTRYSYTATVTSEGTMTVLGATDSIKTITITADSSGIAHPIDPVNNFQIILSKNNGFVQVFDLYTFPYHRPDTVKHITEDTEIYLRWFDYYLDVVLNNLGTCDLGVCHDNLPDTINSIFHLFSFHNPRDTEIYNFSIGDVYETYFTVSGPSTFYQQYTLDTVTTKTITPYYVSYTGPGYEEIINMNIMYYTITYDTTYGVPGYASSGDTNFLVSPVYLPEELNSGYLLHYYPHLFPGILSCDSPASYEIDVDLRGTGFYYNGIIYAPWSTSHTYTIGYGMSGMSQFNSMTSLTYTQYYNYYLKNGIACGTLFPTYHKPVSVVPISLNNLIFISPNPASGYINITAANLSLENAFITAYDMSGRCVYHSAEALQNGVTINTTSWQDGLYMVIIQNDNGIIKKEKVVIVK